MVLDTQDIFNMLKADTSLFSLLQKEHILFLQKDQRDNIIRKIVDTLTWNREPREKEIFYEAIIQREEVVSTGIGMEIAIPHAKLPMLGDFIVGIAIIEDPGVDWQAIDGLPVKMVFLLGGPQDSHREYLQILSQLTQSLKQPEIRHKILSCKSREALVKIFETC